MVGGHAGSAFLATRPCMCRRLPLRTNVQQLLPNSLCSHTSIATRTVCQQPRCHQPRAEELGTLWPSWHHGPHWPPARSMAPVTHKPGPTRASADRGHQRVVDQQTQNAILAVCRGHRAMLGSSCQPSAPLPLQEVRGELDRDHVWPLHGSHRFSTGASCQEAGGRVVGWAEETTAWKLRHNCSPALG